MQNVKRDAKHNLLFYEKQIGEVLRKKQFFQMNQDLNKRFKKIQKQFKYHRLAIYLYSFSTFLEIMLIGNFESKFLRSVLEDLSDHDLQYLSFYTKCYDQIEKLASSSVQTHLLKGLAKVNKFTGKQIAKIPVVSKSPVDEFLIDSSEQIVKRNQEKLEEIMSEFRSNRSTGSLVFRNNIETVERLHNQPTELLIKGDSVYISAST